MRRAVIFCFFLVCSCSRREQSAEPIAATAAPIPPSPTTTTPTGAAASAGAPNGPKTLPTSEAECTSQCNGKWGRHGLSPKDSCLCRTNDGGKRCRDGSECAGECTLTDPPATEVVDKGPPARGYFVGTCSEYTTVFGCLARLGHGVLKDGPVDLSQPPGKLCAD